MSEHTFAAADGTEVFYRRWEPDSDPKAVVVVVHGASEHSGRYARFGGALNAAGYAAYALDTRGHGNTSKSTGAGQLGPAGAEGLLTDIRALIEIAGKDHSALPVFLFGHSLGTMMVQPYVERFGEGLAGYILCGSPGRAEGAEQVLELIRAAADSPMASEAADMLSGFNEAFEPARTKFDWLSRDPAEVDAYINDPYCGDNHQLTYGYLAGIMQLSIPAMEPSEIAKVPGLPVLLITGERDPVSAQGAQVRVLEKDLREAGLDVTAHYYPEARHEILNDTNRDEVTADVVAWLDSRLGS